MEDSTQDLKTIIHEEVNKPLENIVKKLDKSKKPNYITAIAYSIFGLFILWFLYKLWELLEQFFYMKL